MSTRLTFLLTAAVLALPLQANADCAARIAVVEEHPSLGQAQTSEDQAASGQAGAQGRQQTQSSSSARGGSIRVDGGTSLHAEGGPATPSESWFTDSGDDDKASVLTYLESARKARQAGDEQACLNSVQQAESALKSK